MKVPYYDGAAWSEIEHPWPWADDENEPTRLKRFGLEQNWELGDEEGDCVRLLRAPDGRYLLLVEGWSRCDEVVAAHVGAAMDLASRWSVAFRMQEKEASHTLATVALRAFEAWHRHPLNPDDKASGCIYCNRAWEDERAERLRQRMEASSLRTAGGV